MVVKYWNNYKRTRRFSISRWLQ